MPECFLVGPMALLVLLPRIAQPRLVSPGFFSTSPLRLFLVLPARSRLPFPGFRPPAISNWPTFVLSGIPPPASGAPASLSSGTALIRKTSRRHVLVDRSIMVRTARWRPRLNSSFGSLLRGSCA